MQPFVTHRGRLAVLDWTDVNTDLIIPARYLKRIERTGFGPLLFADKRYAPGGAPAIDDPEHHGAENPDFPLNDPALAGATILVVGRNFGCGSSREHAPWALLDFGIRCVIAPSFADIFYGNCFKNGILPIKLPQEIVDKLMDDAERGANAIISIDLEKQEIKGPDGGTVKFEVDEFRKACLLNGWDDIGLTMRAEDKIDSFEKQQHVQAPWL
jgi:3-isopropylmalate/(R)-2-methylmalate dehydratase small subunit